MGEYEDLPFSVKNSSGHPRLEWDNKVIVECLNHIYHRQADILNRLDKIEKYLKTIEDNVVEF